MGEDEVERLVEGCILYGVVEAVEGFLPHEVVHVARLVEKLRYDHVENLTSTEVF